MQSYRILYFLVSESRFRFPSPIIEFQLKSFNDLITIPEFRFQSPIIESYIFGFRIKIYDSQVPISDFQFLISDSWFPSSWFPSSEFPVTFSELSISRIPILKFRFTRSNLFSILIQCFVFSMTMSNQLRFSSSDFRILISDFWF